MPFPELVALACQEQWETLVAELPRALAENPSCLAEIYGHGAVEPFYEESTLLHVACTFSTVPLSVVNALLEAKPDLVSSLDGHGQNPLHVAISFSCPAVVITALVQASPASAQHRDFSLLRPIDLLCQKIIMQEERFKYAKHNASSASYQHQEQQKQQLARLWDCVHPLATAQDASAGYDWEAPLLHSCLKANSNDFPYALLERVMKLQEHQFRMADIGGNYPLHIVAGLSPDDDLDDNYISQIALHFPEAAQRENHAGQLPLDLAIQARQWDTGIFALLEVYPVPDRFSIALSAEILGKAASNHRSTLVFEMLRNQLGFFRYR